MKAKEAPEKLYVNFHFIETHPESHQPLVTKQGINKYDIEYIKKDAFIEKVVKFMEKIDNVDEYTWYNEEEHAVGITEKCIEDFKKYIEGE